MITRRGFLSALAVAVAGSTLDPERLLWVPGAKTIFLPPVKSVTRMTRVLVAPSAMKIGDIFTLNGVFAIEPTTLTPTKQLQQFVVTSDVTLGAPVTMALWPPLRADGFWKNVSSLPPDDVQVRPITFDFVASPTVRGRRVRG